MTPRISAFGDSALMAELGDEFDESVAAWARTLAQLWNFGPAVPAYTSVVVSFDPAHVDADIAERKLRDLVDRGPTYAYEAKPNAPATRPRLQWTRVCGRSCGRQREAGLRLNVKAQPAGGLTR